MTVEELITQLRSKRQDRAVRSDVTVLIHELERYSLGSEVIASSDDVENLIGATIQGYDNQDRLVIK